MTTLKRAVASLQAWWTRLFILGVLAALLLDIPFWIDLTAIGLILALSLVRSPRRDDHPAVSVLCPVAGRWAALNSPADKVPSHGIRAYGQAFAIDIAHPRPPGFSPRIGWGLRQRRPDEFSSFGEPVYAVAPGTVVAACSRQRDHRARTTWPGLLYLMTVEGLVRESGGARFVVGNHVDLDHGEGVFSLYAHLQRDSLTVAVGDVVAAGYRLGLVGNSGNSSEPHLHFQLMDDPRPSAAAGLPFRWISIEQDPTDTDPTWATGEVRDQIIEGLPANGQVFVARAALSD
jgi:hypothetical protein